MSPLQLFSSGAYAGNINWVVGTAGITSTYSRLPFISTGYGIKFKFVCRVLFIERPKTILFEACQDFFNKF